MTFSFDVMKMGVDEQTDAKLSIQIAKRLKLHWSQTHTDHRVIHELMSRSEISVSEHHKSFFFKCKQKWWKAESCAVNLRVMTDA